MTSLTIGIWGAFTGAMISLVIAVIAGLSARAHLRIYGVARSRPVILATHEQLLELEPAPWDTQGGAWPSPEELSRAENLAYGEMAARCALRARETGRRVQLAVNLAWSLGGALVVGSLVFGLRSVARASGEWHPASTLALFGPMVLIVLSLIIPDGESSAAAYERRAAAYRRDAQASRPAAPEGCCSDPSTCHEHNDEGLLGRGSTTTCWFSRLRGILRRA